MGSTTSSPRNRTRGAGGNPAARFNRTRASSNRPQRGQPCQLHLPGVETRLDRRHVRSGPRLEPAPNDFRSLGGQLTQVVLQVRQLLEIKHLDGRVGRFRQEQLRFASQRRLRSRDSGLGRRHAPSPLATRGNRKRQSRGEDRGTVPVDRRFAVRNPLRVRQQARGHQPPPGRLDLVRSCLQQRVVIHGVLEDLFQGHPAILAGVRS